MSPGIEPRQEAQDKFAPSSSSPEPRPRAQRPRTEEPAPPATGIDARGIVTELLQHQHPAGCVRMRCTRDVIQPLSRILAGDDDHAGEDGRETLAILRDFLRVCEADETERRWWGPGMFSDRRWPVVKGIVEQARARWARDAETRRQREIQEQESAAEAAARNGPTSSDEELAAKASQLGGFDLDAILGRRKGHDAKDRKEQTA